MFTASVPLDVNIRQVYDLHFPRAQLGKVVVYTIREKPGDPDDRLIVVDPATGKRHGVADRRRETSRASGD